MLTTISTTPHLLGLSPLSIFVSVKNATDNKKRKTMGKDDCSPDQVPGASSEKAAQTGPPDKAPPHRRLFLNQQRALATVQREYRIGNSIVIEGEIGVGYTRLVAPHLGTELTSV